MSIFIRQLLIKAFIMYLLKIKGTKSMPDFVQLRDENMTLLAYFTTNNVQESLKNFGLKKRKRKRVLKVINELDCGTLTQIDVR